MKPYRLKALSILLVAMAPRLVLTAPPVIYDGEGGSLNFEFPTPGIYDLSGTYSDVGGSSKLVYTMVQDSKGRIAGAGSHDFGGGFKIKLQITGSVKKSKDKTVIKYKMFGKGKDLAFQSFFEGEVSGEGPGSSLKGEISTRVCVIGLKCSITKMPYSIGSYGGGDWSLEATMDAEGRKIIGVASLSTSIKSLNRKRTVSCSVSGKLAKDGATAIINIKSLEKGQGGTLKLKVGVEPNEDGTLGVTRVLEAKGNLLGQKFKADY